MDPEFMSLIDALTKEKGINKDVLLDTIKHALQTAYKKKVGKEDDVELPCTSIKVIGSETILVDSSVAKCTKNKFWCFKSLFG